MAKKELGVTAQNVGIDISMDTFQSCFMNRYEDRTEKIKGSRKIKNKLSGFKELVVWLEKRRVAEVPFFITMEATGVYYESIAYYLTSLGYHVSVVLPNMSSAYTKSLNIKTKTDKMDAKTLARMGLERRLEKWEPMSDQMYEIKKGCRERVRLQKAKTVLSNQVHAEKHSAKPSLKMLQRAKKLENLLDEQIQEIEKEVKEMIDRDKQLKERVDKICKTKGLGWITVITVIAENNGFALIKKRNQLTGYAGYDIVERQSGTSIRGKTRISKKGNSYIRRALYMPAMSAARYNEEFKNLYERVLERTRIPMKANVAVQRKLLILIWTLFKNNEEYDPNRWKTYGAGGTEQQSKTEENQCLEHTTTK